MTEDFDPYHRWLGIPPKYQPPDHYRLLGLETLENDREVIRDAAERQMGHVRQYHLGSHAELSQRILNELAAAKACLLDPDKKAAYDAQFQVQVEPARGLLRAKPLPPHQTPPQGVTTPVVHPAAARTPPPLPASAVAPARQARATTRRLLLLGLVAAAAGTGLVVAMILWGAGRDPRSVTVAPTRGEQAQISPKKPPAVPPQPIAANPPAKPNPKTAPKAAPVDLAPWQQVAGRVASAVVRLQTTGADGQARRIRSAEEERNQIAKTPPPKPADAILFPSGRAFSDDFYRTALANSQQLVFAAAGNPTGILKVKAVGGFPVAYVDAGLSGAAAAFYDKAATMPGVYLGYRNEVRHGLTAAWDEENRPTYSCQYNAGKRDGLCCLFQGGQPRLAAELRDGAYLGILLLAGGKVEKSFPNAAAARADSTAGPMFAEIDKIEAEIGRIEKMMLRKFREEMDDRKEEARRQLAAKQSVQARERSQQRMNQRALDNEDVFRGLKDKGMGRR